MVLIGDSGYIIYKDRVEYLSEHPYGRIFFAVFSSDSEV